MLGILGEQTTLFLPLTGPQPPNSSSPQAAKSGATWLSTGETDCSPQPRGPLNVQWAHAPRGHSQV